MKAIEDSVVSLYFERPQMNVIEMAKSLEITRDAVEQILTLKGLPFKSMVRHKGRPVTRGAEIIAMMAQYPELKVRQIAERTGSSISYVKLIRRKYRKRSHI